MSIDAWNKITQTHDLLKKIIAPLKQHLGINFGYMIVFNDGSYYQIIEDLECLKKWVTNVETSHIFCAKNVTTYFDEPYNFTIWPEEPTCVAMEIYKEYSMWNGITVSKTNKDYTELYWFTKNNAENDWHKWFIRNKQFLRDFIKFFSAYKSKLHILEDVSAQDTFKFSDYFNTNIKNSKYLNQELDELYCAKALLLSNSALIEEFDKRKFSPREVEVLSMICHGYTTKLIAIKLDISAKTVAEYSSRIKRKTGVQYKTELIQLYENYFHKLLLIND